MRRSNWLVVVLLALLASWPEMTSAKCSVTPLEGARSPWIAYACVQADLSDVAEVPSDAQWLEFQVSRIPGLPADAFARFRDLRRLTFYNCDLRDLSPHAFRGLEDLEWLVLSNTRLGLARASLFRHLPNLKRLTLDGAGLLYIEPEVFGNFRHLETLSVRDNDLDCLPIHALHALPRLRTVQIGRNPWLCDCRKSLRKFFEGRGILHGPDEGCAAINDTRVSCSPGVYDCMTTLDYPALPAPQANFTTIASHSHGRFEWRDSAATGIASLERLPDETSWLQILNVEIAKIRRYTFFRFGNTLRSIELDNCGVREIEREAFAGLHKLERLVLVGNRLVTIGRDWFRDLGRVRELILRGNAIERIEEHALAHLTELTRLDVSENRLTCLHVDQLRGLVALRNLNIAGNPMCGCKDGLLRYLNDRDVEYTVSAGGCEVRPTTNDASGSKFSWNSTTTGTIRWSWASKSHWPPVPRPTMPPTTTTPRTIYNPPARPPVRCRMVNNAGHRTEIGSCLCTRASLSDLDTVPGTIRTIKFSGSVISTIYDDVFRKFGSNLRELEFRECSVQWIETRAFHGLWNLETLVIRGNYLEIVESIWFEHLSNLKTLDLARNKITRIESGVFDRVPNLRSLDVSDNRMNCINTEHLEALQHLRELKITGNPWTCLCATLLLEMMRKKHVSCYCNPDVLMQRIEGGWACSAHDVPATRPTWTPPTQPNWPNPPTQPPPTWTNPPAQPPSTWTNPPTQSTRPPSPHPPQTTTAATPTLPSGPPTGNCDRSIGTTGDSWYNCANGDISVLLHIPSYVTKIEIRDSYIPSLPAMVFGRFENLTDLVLINCTLNDVDHRAFAGLTKLKRLTLRYNRFTVVKSGWFRETSNVESIDLSDNDLSDIEIGSFEGLNRLEYLNFEGNAFSCIFTSCLVGVPRLAIVEFGRNNRHLSWRCWEELEEFLTIRGIKYTNYNCPHNGRDIVKTVLTDDKVQAQPSTGGTTDSASFYSAKILTVCLFVVIRLNL